MFRYRKQCTEKEIYFAFMKISPMKFQFSDSKSLIQCIFNVESTCGKFFIKDKWYNKKNESK